MRSALRRWALLALAVPLLAHATLTDEQREPILVAPEASLPVLPPPVLPPSDGPPSLAPFLLTVPEDPPPPEQLAGLVLFRFASAPR